jgi:hypothetical protein
MQACQRLSPALNATFTAAILCCPSLIIGCCLCGYRSFVKPLILIYQGVIHNHAGARVRAAKVFARTGSLPPGFGDRLAAAAVFRDNRGLP